MSARSIRKPRPVAKGLAEPLRQIGRTFVQAGKCRLIYFGGCDYHRMASDPEVLKAFQNGVAELGLNVSASRKTTGNHQAYQELETRLAGFFGAQAAVLVANGFLTNVAVAEALRGEVDHVFMDERAHSSIAMACLHFKCRITKFPHRNAEALAKAVHGERAVKRLALLTDGLFAHDGSVAPLDEYDRVLPASAWLIVDDSHGAGVLGSRGRGTAEHLGLKRRRMIQTVTLSKAFGAFGGALLAERKVVDAIIQKSTVFAGATPFPLPFAKAVLQAMKLIHSKPGILKRLHANVAFVKQRLIIAGILTAGTPGPIVSVIPRDASHAARLKRRLLAQGIYPSLIRYGAGPKGGHFRFAISGEHTAEQLEKLVEALSPD